MEQEGEKRAPNIPVETPAPETTNTPAKKPMLETWHKVALSVVLALLTTLGVKIFVVMYSNESNYAFYFYNYRINSADKNMFEKKFKKINPNQYDEKKQINIHKFVTRIQNQKLISDVSWPNHIPRGDFSYHTLTYGMNFYFNEKYLIFRKQLFDRLTKIMLENESVLKSYFEEAGVKPPFIDKDGKVIYESLYVPSVINVEKIDFEGAIKRTFQENKEVNQFAYVILTLTLHINRGTELLTSYKSMHPNNDILYQAFVDFNATNVDDSGEISKIDKKDAEKYILDFITQMGSTNVIVFYNFLYSHAFYIFYYSTISAGLNFGKQKPSQAHREMHVARIFADIFSGTFVGGGVQKSKPVEPNFLVKFFGKHYKKEYNAKKDKALYEEGMKNDANNKELLIEMQTKIIEVQ